MSITSKKITTTSVLAGVTPSGKALPVISNDIDPIIDDLTSIDARVTLLDAGTFSGSVTAPLGVSQGTSNVTEFTVLTTLTATQIVGTSAGDIGHTDGAVLVAAPSSSYALEFVSAVLIFDYATAAYTGGNDDGVIRVGSVAHTAALTDANYVKGTGDKVYVVRALNTAELSLPVGSTINLMGTALTQPGTAAGVLRVYTTYRKIATGL